MVDVVKEFLMFYLKTKNDKNIKVYDSDNYGRCKISKQQAHELIGRLNLIDEKSPIFNSGRTWRQVV